MFIISNPDKFHLNPHSLQTVSRRRRRRRPSPPQRPPALLIRLTVPLSQW
jgi:hypothetical protein